MDKLRFLAHAEVVTKSVNRAGRSLPLQNVMFAEAPLPVATPVAEGREPHRITPVTRWLFGSTVAVFLFQFLVFKLSGTDRLGDSLAFSSESWAHHDYWTVLTYAWLHAVDLPGVPGLFWIHLVANMLPLLFLGPPLENYLGPWRFLGLYLGGAVAAALGWFLLHPTSDEGVVGASGAIFALIAAAGTVAPRARVMVYLFFLLPIPMNLMTLALVACGVEALQMVFHWLPEVAHAAHLSGALFGLLYVLTLRLIFQAGEASVSRD